jgi:hypothetical protein
MAGLFSAISHLESVLLELHFIAPETDQQAISVSRGVALASTVINPALEETPTHIFCGLPASVKQSCETCQNGSAAYRWVKQQAGVPAEGDKLICRVCASLTVLVGSPYGLSVR